MVNDLCLDTRQHLVLRSLTEMPAILTRILEELEHLGYSPKERFGIRLALEEALVNATAVIRPRRCRSTITHPTNNLPSKFRMKAQAFARNACPIRSTRKTSTVRAAAACC